MMPSLSLTSELPGSLRLLSVELREGMSWLRFDNFSHLLFYISAVDANKIAFNVVLS